MPQSDDKKDLTPKPTEEKTKLQRARVLGGFRLDDIDYHPNDIIEASVTLIESLGSSVDPDPDSVKYAIENESGAVKKHPTK